MAEPAVYTLSDTANRFFCPQAPSASLFYKEAYSQKLDHFYNNVQGQKNRNGRHKNDVQRNNSLTGGRTGAESLCTTLGRSGHIETAEAFHCMFSLRKF